MAIDNSELFVETFKIRGISSEFTVEFNVAQLELKSMEGDMDCDTSNFGISMVLRVEFC